MKRSKKLFAIPAAVAASLVAGTVVWAFWLSSGTGNASASAGSLGKPGTPNASTTIGTGTVTVSWAGISSPSGTAADVTYEVRRSGSGVECTATAPATTCNDANVEDGFYTYTVTAKFNSWSSASGQSNEVEVINDNVPPAVPAPSVSAPVIFGTNPIFVTHETLTLSSAATDTGVGATGVATVKYYFCAGSGSCTAGTGTLIDTSATAAGAYPVTWSTSTLADGPYQVIAVAKDNANNQATSPPTAISVDTTPPSVSTPIVNG